MLWAAFDCSINGALEALPCVWMLISCVFAFSGFGMIRPLLKASLTSPKRAH